MKKGRNLTQPKVSYFFYRKSFVTHSLTHSILGKSVFLFSSLEKKSCFFFFPWKSLDATHSPGKKSGYTKDVITLVNRDKNSVFYRPLPWDKSNTKKSEFTPVNQRKPGKKNYSHVFFFPKKIATGNVFFFPRKSLNRTHTLNFRGRKKKTGQEKKNTIFTNTHDFFKKVVIFKLFPEKKNTVPLPETIKKINEIHATK